MTNPKRRVFRPRFDLMESKCLLSGGAGLATVHQESIVNLLPTQVGADALNAVEESAPHTDRQRIVFRTLTANSAAGTISGTALGLYHVPIIGSLTATIKFTTSIDAPRAKDVKVSLNKYNIFLKASDRNRIAEAVATFIQNDQSAIQAQFPTS